MRSPRFGLCFLVLALFYTIHGIEGQCPALAPDMTMTKKDGSRLYGHVINWLYAQKEVLCRLKCNMVERCLTYNYEIATEICELNDADDENDLQETQGFVYVDIKKPSKSLGCFLDKGVDNSRPFPQLIVNYREAIDWHDLKTSVIDKCAKKTKERGYTYFGIQFYGECWSGPDDDVQYDRDGPSTDCRNGVGEEKSFMVYQVPGLKQKKVM
ncbi:uncharacterized protein LOC110254475 [Exaiptasia diaphana]|uniref:Apple domain-containing protein n=1 Tax=Exaiptasia diaphana TaxID=2652724 RepID=A0A913Y983_EXADI|nr:uncharacterized protein LOC110254475 [Exaiptasia diaphana]